MNWSTTTSLIAPGNTFQLATSKDLIVYYDTSNASPINAKRGGGFVGPVMTIRRRNVDGVYEFVGNFTETTAPFVSTNGKWVMIFGDGNAVFNIDSDNVISKAYYIPTYGGYFLSDDTFVGYDSNSPTNDGNFTIRTYQYEASNDTWNNIPGTELTVTIDALFQGDIASYRASDTHLVFIDPTNGNNVTIQIYSRQADKSWKFVESVPVNSTFSEFDKSVNYNGLDTLTLTYFATTGDADLGIVFTYTKINGKWIEQTFTPSSVGFRPQGNLGGVVTFLDSNTLLVTAALEGYTSGSPNNVGKVLVMIRNSDGLWEPSGYVGNPKATGIWGTVVAINDYDVIIPIFTSLNIETRDTTLTLYTAPLCFVQPINVTCNDQQVSDCSQLDISSLYTIKGVQCGNVTATLNGLSLVDNKALQAQFSFSKGTVATASCNATVTCPAPPVAVQQQTPSKVSSAVVLVQSGLASLLFGFIFLFI